MANGYEELGHRIAVLRALRHLSQEALAQRIGVKRGSVAAWEVGKAGPGRDTLPRVADALSVSVDALLGRAPVDGPPSLPMRAAARFRTAREARGLSVADVVRPLGITTTAVERLETGALPEASLLAILAARVGVSLDALFADDPPAANGLANLRVDGVGGHDEGGALGAPEGGLPMPDPWAMLDRLTQAQLNYSEAAKTQAQAMADMAAAVRQESGPPHDADRPDAPVGRAQNE